MSKDVIVFILYDRETGKVLSEKRPADSSVYPNQVIFPSGGVEAHEMADFEKAMLREVREEIGVVPTKFTSLDTNQSLSAVEGRFSLHIFLITEWEGEVSSVVLDRGNPLIWETLSAVKASAVENRKEIVERIERFLKK